MKHLAALSLLLSFAVPAAADDTILRGIDVWETKDDGGTYVDLIIPAGFFCATSAPFSGRITLKGVPIQTDPPYVLGRTDTIIDRQADTTFSANATQVNAVVRAACFAGTSAVTVSGCSGSAYWDVKSIAAPTQSSFSITIRRPTPTASGGTFDSTVKITPRLVFTQQGSGVQRTLNQAEIHFTTTLAEWTHQPGAGGVKHHSGVLVDTDCDGSPETNLPGTSNFSPGWSPNPTPGCSTPPCRVGVPHEAGPHRHRVSPPPAPIFNLCDNGGYQTSSHYALGSSCVEARAVLRAETLAEAGAYCGSVTKVCGFIMTMMSSCYWEENPGAFIVHGFATFGCRECSNCS